MTSPAGTRRSRFQTSMRERRCVAEVDGHVEERVGRAPQRRRAGVSRQRPPAAGGRATASSPGQLGRPGRRRWCRRRAARSPAADAARCPGQAHRADGGGKHVSSAAGQPHHRCAFRSRGAIFAGRPARPPAGRITQGLERDRMCARDDSPGDGIDDGDGRRRPHRLPRGRDPCGPAARDGGARHRLP